MNYASAFDVVICAMPFVPHLSPLPWSCRRHDGPAITSSRIEVSTCCYSIYTAKSTAHSDWNVGLVRVNVAGQIFSRRADVKRFAPTPRTVERGESPALSCSGCLAPHSTRTSISFAYCHFGGMVTGQGPCSAQFFQFGVKNRDSI